MPSSTQFPFPSGTAPEPQVVEWLAEVLYPENDRSYAKKLVRSRIRYARKIKKDPRLRKLKNGHINVSQFFGWAVLQKKEWKALIEVGGLRADTTVILGHNEPIPAIVADIGGVDAYDIPNDPNELKALYRAERQKRQKTAEVETENKQLKDQLLTKAERSRLASEYGKEGGRGKKK